MAKKIKLGTKIRCKVTGLEGVATSRIEYLNGCVQYGLTPKAKENEAKYPDTAYLDEDQIEIIKAKKVEVKSTRTGGPQINQPSR